MKKTVILAAVLMASTLLMGARCGQEGPAEKAGETLDGTKDHPIRDAVNPDGLGEKAGKKIDEGVEKTKDGIEDLKKDKDKD